MQRFWIHRRQADLEMKSGGNVEDIKKHLHFAAASLGRSVPVKSRLELFASAIWQLTHQLLYRLGVTRWFINRAGGFALDPVDRLVNLIIQIVNLNYIMNPLSFHKNSFDGITEKAKCRKPLYHLFLS